MIAVPAVTAVSKPEEEMVATEPLLLSHVPPPVAFVSDDVAATHTLRLPEMVVGRGDAFTVIGEVVEQPAPEVVVTEYMFAPAVAGVSEGEEQVVQERPPGPDHR